MAKMVERRRTVSESSISNPRVLSSKKSISNEKTSNKTLLNGPKHRKVSCPPKIMGNSAEHSGTTYPMFWSKSAASNLQKSYQKTSYISSREAVHSLPEEKYYPSIQSTGSRTVDNVVIIPIELKVEASEDFKKVLREYLIETRIPDNRNF